MAIDYVIIGDIDLCYARWSGVISHHDALANFARYLQDPLYRPGRPELIDLRDLQELQVDVSMMRSLLDQANAQNFRDQAATLTVVLAVNDVAFGQARQYQSLASLQDGIDVRLHRSEPAALAELGRHEWTIDELLERHAPDFDTVLQSTGQVWRRHAAGPGSPQLSSQDHHAGRPAQDRAYRS